MTAAAVYAECAAAGVKLSINGDKLGIKAHSSPSAELMEALREHKAELLAYLTAAANNEKAAPRADLFPTDNAAPASPLTRDLDPDALAAWLQSEGLALVLRDGALIYTDPQGLPVPLAGVALVLRQHVASHADAITELLTPPGGG